MAIPLNEEIREEARKMSEYVIDDTKRTVEMLNWMKAQNKSPVTEDNSALGTALKAGAAFATGNIIDGVSVLANTILPRLRERITEIKKEEITPILNTETLQKLMKINNNILEIRHKLSDTPIDANLIDDHCFDAQQLIYELSKKV